jgi:hypothetical protein
VAPSDPSPPGGRRRKALLDLRVPFFRPMWRRGATVAVLALWTGVEVSMGNPFWALLAGGIGVYAIYVFYFAFDPPGDGPEP